MGAQFDEQYDALLRLKEERMSAAQAKGLGKGLSALMSDSYNTAGAPALTPAEGNLILLPVSALQAGKYQPRQHFDNEALSELADSIEKHGIMQPIVVRAVGNGQYEIIAGERRFRAAKLANVKEVPVIVRELEDTQALEMALVENIQRADLNPIEDAAGYQRLMDEFKYTQDNLSKIVGKSRSHVANLLRLLSLPEKFRKAIDSGALSMGHARALLSASNPEELFTEITQNGISVRQAEEWLQRERGDAPAAPKTGKTGGSSGSSRGGKEKNDDVRQIEQMLADNLGLAVSINTRTNQAGEVVLAYESLTQLDEILRRLGGGV